MPRKFIESVNLVLADGYTEFVTAISAKSCLDAALKAWAEPDNDGCVIVLEMADGTSWQFSPLEHPRFVHGPVRF